MAEKTIEEQILDDAEKELWDSWKELGSIPFGDVVAIHVFLPGGVSPDPLMDRLDKREEVESVTVHTDRLDSFCPITLRVVLQPYRGE